MGFRKAFFWKRLKKLLSISQFWFQIVFSAIWGEKIASLALCVPFSISNSLEVPIFPHWKNLLHTVFQSEQCCRFAVKKRKIPLWMHSPIRAFEPGHLDAAVVNRFPRPNPLFISGCHSHSNTKEYFMAHKQQTTIVVGLLRKIKEEICWIVKMVNYLSNRFHLH